MGCILSGGQCKKKLKVIARSCERPAYKQGSKEVEGFHRG
jgi:hypothetical protein